MLAMSRVRLWGFRCVLWLFVLTSLASAKTKASAGPPRKARTLEGNVTFLWPLRVTTTPLSERPGKNSKPALEPSSFGEELTALALAGYRRYVKEVLPAELERDPAFAKAFWDSDFSRVNFAFKRFQRRALAWHHGIAEAEVPGLSDGRGLEGVKSWPELHASDVFSRLTRRMSSLAWASLVRSGYRDEQLNGSRALIWAEVFEHGDFQRPEMRNDGAFGFGRYWAAAQEGAVNFNFEDPRGINPPYGKIHSFQPRTGDFMVFPPWSSSFVTPNIREEPVVCYCAMFYPPPPAAFVDSREDGTGKFLYTIPLKTAVKA